MKTLKNKKILSVVGVIIVLVLGYAFMSTKTVETKLEASVIQVKNAVQQQKGSAAPKPVQIPQPIPLPQ